MRTGNKSSLPPNTICLVDREECRAVSMLPREWDPQIIYKPCPNIIIRRNKQIIWLCSSLGWEVGQGPLLIRQMKLITRTNNLTMTFFRANKIIRRHISKGVKILAQNTRLVLLNLLTFSPVSAPLLSKRITTTTSKVRATIHPPFTSSQILRMRSPKSVRTHPINRLILATRSFWCARIHKISRLIKIVALCRVVVVVALIKLQLEIVFKLSSMKMILGLRGPCQTTLQQCLLTRMMTAILTL